MDKIFFGQVLRFLVVEMPTAEEYNIQADRFIYAAIRQANITEPANKRCPINYYQNLGRVELVDLNYVRGLIGRIWDRNKWAIVDQNESQAKTNFDS